MRMRMDKNTRHYIDIDLRTKEVLNWGYGNKYEIVKPDFDDPFHYRLFISLGQYNKLVQQHSLLLNEPR